MRNRALVMVFFLVGLLAATSCGWAGTQPIVTSDLLRLRSVTAIDVAKDGGRAVFAVRSILTTPPGPSQDGAAATGHPAQPTYKNQSHLFLLDLANEGVQPRQLTFGDRIDSMPAISPDGKRIAFVREGQTTPSGTDSGKSAGPTSRSQVWIISIDGGEARQLTDFSHGCGQPIWSPDGRRLLVSSSIPISEIDGVPAWPMERPERTWKDADAKPGFEPRPDGTREQIRAWLEMNAQRQNPNTINRLDFQDEQSLKGEMSFQNLFLVDPDAAAMVQSAQARQITSGFYDHNQPAFLPDGQSVVYAAKKPTDQHVDRVDAAALWRVNIDGSNDRRILALDGWTLRNPEPSRDGNFIAFGGQQLDEPAYRQGQLGIAALKTDTASDPAWLTEESTFATEVEDFQWLQAQPAIVFTSSISGARPLLTVSPGLVQPARLVEKIDGLPSEVGVFSVGGGAIVYSAATIAQPCTVRVRDGRGDRQVLDLNTWTADKQLATATEFSITRPDGVNVQCWLMEPTNREPGKKYPLAVQMHGGPMVMWGPAEFSMWHEFQLLCSWGYGVVYCNPRGSAGYGYAFQRGNFQDWGDGPGNDVLACVDQALLKEWVDADRLVITGGSYAGYLTAWIISHDNRFKAAVAQRGVYDLTTFFGESNAWQLVKWTMGGWPFDARFRQVIDRNSPFTYVSRIRTPLLIKHADEDLRAGVSQSEMFYRALKELGRPVEYVRYPGVGHELSRSGDPTQRMDRLNRIIEFFERHIENPRPAPVASQ